MSTTKLTPPYAGIPIAGGMVPSPEYVRWFSDLVKRVGGYEAHPIDELQPMDEKGVAGGYAGLDADALVPADQLGTGTADATTVLYGDGVWREAGGAHVGTATINFGAHPGSNEAFAVVIGQADIPADASVRAWIVALASGSHTASDAAYAAALVGVSCGAVVAGVGFTIYARSVHKMTGTFAVQYEWT